MTMKALDNVFKYLLVGLIFAGGYAALSTGSGVTEIIAGLLGPGIILANLKLDDIFQGKSYIHYDKKTCQIGTAIVVMFDLWLLSPIVMNILGKSIPSNWIFQHRFTLPLWTGAVVGTLLVITGITFIVQAQIGNRKEWGKI